MRPGIQTFLEEAGEAACYALSIIQLGRPDDHDMTISLLIGAINNGYIHYSWDNPDDPDNMYVSQPEKMLAWLTGKVWTVRKEAPEYQLKPGELVVQRWERVSTGKVIGHFRLPDWDSLVNSQTVRLGKIVSLRVFAPA